MVVCWKLLFNLSISIVNCLSVQNSIHKVADPHYRNAACKYWRCHCHWNKAVFAEDNEYTADVTRIKKKQSNVGVNRINGIEIRFLETSHYWKSSVTIPTATVSSPLLSVNLPNSLYCLKSSMQIALLLLMLITADELRAISLGGMVDWIWVAVCLSTNDIIFSILTSCWFECI